MAMSQKAPVVIYNNLKLFNIYFIRIIYNYLFTNNKEIKNTLINNNTKLHFAMSTASSQK